jgi:Tol biopolymer transport system component/tRNA A-37 threonylcarbamoyl transferase component Bud32
LALTSGTRLGPYQIESALGAGGMGEVYKARDTRLDRSVAIKVLPPGLADDPEFRERFDREARAISQLTHPNICTLYDVGDHQGTAYLVMELLEGQTLAARIAKGAMPPAEALPIAIQIGEALAVAHRAGLVHRDLKPGNVMLLNSRPGSAGSPQAKLLDFGLAKAAAGLQTSSGGLSVMPTTPAAMTAQGAIVGTFEYMAPEQVEGREADARSDIFAFGCVLYEMLTGKKAFEGKTHASLIGAIMHAEPPPVSGVVASTSPALDRIVRKSLAKDPDARWQSIRDLVDELKWTIDGGASVASGSASAVTARGNAGASLLRWAIVAIAGVAAVALGLTFAASRKAPQPAPASARFTVTMPDGWGLGAFVPTAGAASVSPDGRYLVISGSVKDEPEMLWLRPIDAPEAHRIPRTENGTGAFWAPDSHSIAFYDTATRQLKRTTVAGDGTTVICEATVPTGADWNRDGIILFAASAGILKVAATGGAPVVVAPRGPGQPEYYVPQFLSDGRHFVYSMFASGVFLATIDGPEQRKLLNGPTTPLRFRGDDALFMRGTTVFSQRLDIKAAALVGEPVPVITDAIAFTASPTVLAYFPTRGRVTDLVWFDRAGQRVGSIGDGADYANVELSPDGARLAVAMMDSRLRTRDIWTYDTARGVRQRFTFSDVEERTAVWSADGGRLLFNRRATNGIALDFFQKRADGSGSEDVILADGLSKDALGWSPDGRYLLYRVTGGSTGNDLLALPTFGDRRPIPLSATSFNEEDGRFSPDGRSVAYSTDESGEHEVYIARFPAGGGKTRVSTAGGSHPRWRRDGKELFYLSLDNKIVSVEISGTGDALRVGDPHPLLTIHPPVQSGYNYDVTPDGRRFLAINDVSPTPLPIVVTNWKSAK